MNLFSIEEAGDKGASRPFPLHPKSPPQRLRFAPDTLRTFLVDEAEHFLHNHHASVASLRLLFTFVPERRSASLRNRCSPSPEYPKNRVSDNVVPCQALLDVLTRALRRARHFALVEGSAIPT